MPHRTVIHGAAGRMGQMLVGVVGAHPDLQLSGALARGAAPEQGRDVGELAGGGATGVLISDDVRGGLAGADVVIDFSAPAATVALVDQCRAAGVALVTGTTGLTPDQTAQVAAASTDIAIVMAPNMSVGVNVTLKLLEAAARAFGDSVDVEVVEMHHRDKVDAPSGTALRMGGVVAAALGRDVATDGVFSRHGQTGPRPDHAIGFAALRGGDTVGDHTVIFAGEGERVEIVHRSQSRLTFATGAARAAVWVAKRQPGLYTMADVLGL